MTRTDKKSRKVKKDKPRPSKDARAIVMNGGDHTRFVIIEPRRFDGNQLYWCVNLAHSSHPTLAGHCQHAIKDIWDRMPLLHHREPDEFGYEGTGVIVAAEPQPGSCLVLTFHLWTSEGIEPEGIKIPSVVLGRIQRVITP